ncbi:MAG TPA: hypothetical protein VLS51_02050, partial [Propionibacteriaceae bacterium]|nr:hypothetical protein [Propionibacteriaceae bacterium]
ESSARRSAMSPYEDDELDDAEPRRSALSPVEPDVQPVRARRSAFTPDERDDPAPGRYSRFQHDPYVASRFDAGDPWTPPLGRRSSEYAVAARAIQPSLPDLGDTPETAPSPAEAPEAPPAAGPDLPLSPPSPSVQPPLPALSVPVEAEFANTELLPPAARAWLPEEPASTDRPAAPVTVKRSTATAAAHAAQVAAVPALAEVTATVAETQELLAQEELMVSEGGHTVETSLMGDDTATWLFGSALTGEDHSLYRRPKPGEPETEVDLTPIVIDDPEYDVRKGVSPRPGATPRPARTHRTSPRRGRSARRVKAAWRDHRRLLTISGIVLALLLVVGVGGYLFSRYDPTVASITQGPLTLPPTAGSFARDPAQGASPSVHPGSKIQTVSATYSLNGTQEFVAIAYRPQTDPSAALAEIQARNITKVNGGACGRATDQSRMACAVVSGTTAVLLMTLVDQSSDELIAAAQSVADGIGRT